MTTKLAFAKSAINFTVGASVTKVVSDIIRNNANAETPLDTIKIMTASVALGSLVADAASDHVDTKVEQIADWYADFKSRPSK